MDIEKKKQETLESIAKQPANVVFARISIVDEIQLADLMKEQFTPYLRQAANTTHLNSDSLHNVPASIVLSPQPLFSITYTIYPSFAIL